jgi:methanogenic corrinoid protein MtbC1
MTFSKTAGHLEDLRTRYLAAQLHGDARQALRIALDDGLGSGFSANEISDGVVRHAQRELGSLWQRNLIGIAEEHMATAISHLVLAQLYRHTEPAPRNGRRLLVACVEGELHELPARLVADALDSGGFDVRFLGANVPTDHLVRMLEQTPPDLVALSATMSFHGTAVRNAVQRIRACQPAMPIAIGGGACEWSPGLADDVNADMTASSAHDFVDSARLLLGVAA